MTNLNPWDLKQTLNLNLFMVTKWLQVIISSAVGFMLFTYVFYSETGELPDEFKNWKYIFAVLVVSNLMAFLFQRFALFLNSYFSWKKHVSTRLFLGIVGKFLIATFIYIFCVFVYAKITQTEISYPEFWQQYYDPTMKLMLLTFITVFIHTITNFTLFSYNEYAVGQIETLVLERKQFELQFEALKSQISPHYLFNCFNTISSLVYQDAKGAETFIRRLVQTYQYILDTKDKKLVSLDEELEFVRAYNYLLKVRFENALILEIDLPTETLQSELPPMTLQMLLENAVKHNVVSDENPLLVNIGCSQTGNIVVSNNKNIKSINGKSHAIGLDNIRKRYRFFTDKPIKILDNEKFEVFLPFLNMKARI